MTYAIFFNDIYVGSFVCDTKKQSIAEQTRLRKAFKGMIIDLVLQ